MTNDGLYGLAAEFETHGELVRAAESAYKHGFRRLDAYTPFPIEELDEALGRTNRIPMLVLLAGVVGGAGGYFMQWYASVVSYPINVGGRPLHSWPSFVPITFELTVLCAALTAFIAALALSGLPRPYHPMFNLPEFERASQDRFFLCIESSDPSFDPRSTRNFLEALQPLRVSEVAR
jgi:hypothetical protein